MPLAFVHLPQPADGQPCAEEASALRESLKDSISLAHLDEKLAERDAQHRENVEDLVAVAERVDGLRKEVDLLNLREDQLKASHSEELERLRAERKKETDDHSKRMAEIHETGEKLSADFQKLSDQLATKEKYWEEEIDQVDRLMAGTIRLPLLSLPAANSRPCLPFSYSC